MTLLTQYFGHLACRIFSEVKQEVVGYPVHGDMLCCARILMCRLFEAFIGLSAMHIQ